MNTRIMRQWGLTVAALLLVLAATCLEANRSLANTPPVDDSQTGEIAKDGKLPGRTPGLSDLGGGRSGGSRGATDPDEFSVNSPGIRLPHVQVEPGPEPGGAVGRMLGFLRMLLSRVVGFGRF